MNLNEFARFIAIEETGKSEVDIAQIKEIMRIIFIRLARLKPLELFKILEKYK